MRLEVHVHHHHDVDAALRHRQVMEAISNLKELYMALSAKLQAAIDDVNARLEQTNSELDAIGAALDNSASVAAAAVATALAKVGVDEDAAADLVTSAFNSVKEHTDAVFAKVGVTPPTTTGSDTTGGAAGDDTISGGAGDDTITASAELVLSTTLPNATVGQGYTGSFDIQGGTAPFQVDTSPSTDNGITVSDTSLSGTPSEARDTVFNVSVKDSGDPVQETSGMVTLHVDAAPDA